MFCVYITEHVFLNDSSSIVISSDNNNNLFHVNSVGPVRSLLLAQTSFDLSIRIEFQKFCFHDVNDIVEIGEGLTQEQETRLAHFGGVATPSPVTTVGSTAWIYINYPFPGRRLRIRIFLTETAGVGMPICLFSLYRFFKWGKIVKPLCISGSFLLLLFGGGGGGMAHCLVEQGYIIFSFVRTMHETFIAYIHLKSPSTLKIIRLKT